jgi:hypothetical protein
VANSVTFFWRADDLNGEIRWFWRDEDCDEPMGPFDNREEAVADHRDMRGARP